MNKTKHCELCENKIIDFKKGLICSLTNKKPDFSEKCNVIRLNENFKTKIKNENITYETILKTRPAVIVHFIIYLSVALLLIGGGFFFGKYTLDSGIISTVPIIIIGTGFFPLGLAFGPINNYIQSLKIAKHNKKNTDTIARIYGYTYNITIKHLIDSLGNKSYDVNLNLLKTNNQNI